MVSRRFVLGAGFVYVGFLLFFVGFAINATSEPLFDEFGKALVPISLTQPLRASIIQMVGGFIAVTGILICISSLAKPPALTEIGQRMPDSLPVQATGGVSATTNALTLPPNCKFCGVPLRNGESFCPSCQRSQT